MNGDRDPFDGPSPMGPLGEAMARLAEDAPAANFSASTIRYEHAGRRSGRWNVLGGVAAGMAAVAVLVVVVGFLFRGGGGSASTAGASNTLLSSAASSAAGSASSTASAFSSAGPSAGAPPPDGAGPGGSTVDGAAEVPDGSSCRPAAALTDAELAAVESAVPGLTRGDSCAAGDAVATQRYTVVGGTLLVERRGAGYDPCTATDGSGCADVPGHPGVRTTVGTVQQVWIDGPDGSVVLTVTPPGAVPVATLAAAAEALSAAGP